MRKLDTDVLIVGSGAAGGTLAATLAERTKLKVLLIEKGGFVRKEAFNQRELDMGALLYAEAGRRSTSDGSIPVRCGQCVGGGTTVNLALCFDPVRSVWDRWKITSSIRGHSLDQTASDFGHPGLNMSDCLQEVRKRLNVGKATFTQINDNNRLFAQGCRHLGLSTKRFELNMRNCRECGFCQLGCAYDHKQSTVVTYIADALKQGVQLLHHCDVDKIRFARRDNEIIATGITGMVRPTSPGSHANLVPPGPVDISARLVIIAAGAIETPCLLQRSEHPDPWQQIGRGLVLHPSLPVVGVFDRKLTNYRGITGTVYSDHYLDTHGFYFECLFGHPAYGAVLIPGFGIEHFDIMRRYSYLGGFGAMLIDTPQADNRVTYDPATRQPRIHYQLYSKDKERLRFASQKAVEIMFAAGAKKVILPSEEQLGPLASPVFTHASQAVHCQQLGFHPHQTLVTSAHPQATTRMGEDRRNSVVNSRCESHAVKRLVVCDGSVFPTSCGANPMISIMTLARYHAKRIAAEWQRYSL
jgi:choline dehydrogenase-like flavoprotein